MVSDCPAAHLDDQRNDRRGPAPGAVGGWGNDQRRDRPARGHRADPDRCPNDAPTRGLGLHCPHLDRRGPTPERSAVEHPGEGDTRPRRIDHHRGRSLDPQETTCQVVPKGYWHRYISAHEPPLARAVATAYPKSVQRTQRQTLAPTREPGSCDAARPADPPWIRPSVDDQRKAQSQPADTPTQRRASS